MVVSLESEVITIVFEAIFEAMEAGRVLPVDVVPAVTFVSPALVVIFLQGPWCAMKPKQ